MCKSCGIYILVPVMFESITAQCELVVRAEGALPHRPPPRLPALEILFEFEEDDQGLLDLSFLMGPPATGAPAVLKSKQETSANITASLYETIHPRGSFLGAGLRCQVCL